MRRRENGRREIQNPLTLDELRRLADQVRLLREPAGAFALGTGLHPEPISLPDFLSPEEQERHEVRAAEAALWAEYQDWRRREGLNPSATYLNRFACVAREAAACGQMFAPWMVDD